jgi:hypothetical protein
MPPRAEEAIERLYEIAPRWDKYRLKHLYMNWAKTIERALNEDASIENLYATEVIVNVFDGGPKTKVDLAIGGAAPIAMTPDRRADPLANELFTRNEATKKSWVKAEICSHIWTARLPDSLKPGTHTLKVVIQDEYGREFTECAVLEVTST